MNGEWNEWVTLAGLAYWWMSIGLVQNDFRAHAIDKPAYARSGGLHIIPVIMYLPIAQLLFYNVGGPGRVPKILVGALVHFALICAGFWVLGFLIEIFWTRALIVGGILLFYTVIFLVPIRN